MLLNLLSWSDHLLNGLNTQAGWCVHRRVRSIYLYSSLTILWKDNLLSYHPPDWYCRWTNALKNDHSCALQPCHTLQTEPNPGPQGRNCILTSLFGTDILSSVFKCFPKKPLSSWPRQRPLPLACHREKSDAVLRLTEREGSVRRQQQVQLWQLPCCC